jgi:hypothetical protein
MQYRHNIMLKASQLLFLTSLLSYGGAVREVKIEDGADQRGGREEREGPPEVPGQVIVHKTEGKGVPAPGGDAHGAEEAGGVLGEHQLEGAHA